jgi:hypothetical protein
MLRSQVGLTIDPSQYKDKNIYYHNFKTLLGDWTKTKFGSWAKLTVDWSKHKDKMVIIIVLKSN